MPVKPCLGYRSRTDAVLALLAEGRTPSQIAERIGRESGEFVTEKMVLDLETSARRIRNRKIADLDARIKPTLIAAANINRGRVIRFLERVLIELRAAQ